MVVAYELSQSFKQFCCCSLLTSKLDTPGRNNTMTPGVDVTFTAHYHHVTLSSGNRNQPLPLGTSDQLLFKKAPYAF